MWDTSGRFATSDQWRSSHLDILDLSRGGRIRGGGKNWPKI